jgi:hypothetical protein
MKHKNEQQYIIVKMERVLFLIVKNEGNTN